MALSGNEYIPNQLDQTLAQRFNEALNLARAADENAEGHFKQNLFDVFKEIFNQIKEIFERLVQVGVRMTNFEGRLNESDKITCSLIAELKKNSDEQNDRINDLSARLLTAEQKNSEMKDELTSLKDRLAKHQHSYLMPWGSQSRSACTTVPVN